ncbi:uncharacterized protein YjiS (DUF1127 family) [Bradyrhizobium elkanii]|uniref:DUF1127 domain-containing protein n=1 Tax=Bradyrhizobium TaxID=374 RepID=UPI001FFB5F0A|nr:MULTISPECIES: DUF1127 domain-containing protein [Bradyrhizobium]MCK1463465.1 DUF1127 domain-containing protein [Bradyrhizobium sp. 2]MCS3931907.1 uncharacterized protein YjiS (DUF1127 family) [Bradyrhizobium elkanii]MCS3972465.1 uncharacterized protein YjiS (DUF1127 family) [Bradyrhizobium japonicum]
MTTTHGTTWLEWTSVSTWHVTSFISKYWDAFQERRERQKLSATLSDLSDGELMDIGTTRGEIDYVASHRGIDPGGIRSGEWLRYLPTVDGQVGPRPTADIEGRQWNDRGGQIKSGFIR